MPTIISPAMRVVMRAGIDANTYTCDVYAYNYITRDAGGNAGGDRRGRGGRRCACAGAVAVTAQAPPLATGERGRLCPPRLRCRSTGGCRDIAPPALAAAIHGGHAGGD